MLHREEVVEADDGALEFCSAIRDQKIRCPKHIIPQPTESVCGPIGTGLKLQSPHVVVGELVDVVDHRVLHPLDVSNEEHVSTDPLVEVRGLGIGDLRFAAGWPMLQT